MVANVQKAIKLIYLGDTYWLTTKVCLKNVGWRQKKTRLLSIYSLLVNLTEPIRTHGPQSYFRSKISILSQVVPNVQKAIKLIYLGDTNWLTTEMCLF